jgi:hypothetical protein
MLSVVVANFDEIFNSIFFLKNKELATKYFLSKIFFAKWRKIRHKKIN